MQSTSAYRKLMGDMFSDPTLFTLLLSNLVFSFVYVMQGGTFPTLLWVYWSQSVIIGFFSFIRIYSQRAFSVKGMRVSRTEVGKHNTAYYFLITYGGFHLAYALGLYKTFGFFPDTHVLLIGIAVFFLHHTFSFARHITYERNIERHLGALSLYPYIRILPIQLIGILGLPVAFSIITFLVLKTIADCAMHMVEHRMFAR